MEGLGRDLGGDQGCKQGDEDQALPICIAEVGEPVEGASPCVSPSVVAQILMIQKPKVTSGTLLAISRIGPAMGSYGSY